MDNSTISTIAATAQTAVSALAMLAPFVGAPGVAAGPILAGVAQLIPVVAQEASDLLPEIENIIAKMRGTGTVSAADLDALSAMLDKAKADFEAAATAAGDPAPST